jgi:hypothetical protein
MYRANLKNSPLEEGIRTIGPSRGLSPIRAVGAETDVGRRNGRSSTAGPMVRIRFPPLRVRSHQCPAAQPAHNPRLGGGLHTGWDVRRDGPARTGAPSPFFSVGLRCSPTSGELPNRLGCVDAASRRRDSTHPAPASPAPSRSCPRQLVRRLRFRPALDRNRADAVLRAAFDNPVAVGHIDQYVALPVEEANDLKCFE